MLGSNRSRVTAGVAVLVGIAGLSFVLAGAAAARGPGGAGRVHPGREAQEARRLPQVGLRRHAADPQRAQRRRGPVPRLPRRLHRPGELRPLREDRRVPRRHRDDQGTRRHRGQGGDQRQGLLHGRLHRPGGVDQGLEAVQGRAGQLGLLQLRPPLPAEGRGDEAERRRRATRATRPAPRRTTSSASSTPSCVRRPRSRSEVDRSGRGPDRPGRALFPKLRRHIP